MRSRKLCVSPPISAKVLNGEVSLAHLPVPQMMGDSAQSGSFYYGGDSGGAMYMKKHRQGRLRSLKHKHNRWIEEYFASLDRQVQSVESETFSGQGASRVVEEVHRLRTHSAKDNWLVSEWVTHCHFNDRLDPTEQAN